METLASKREQLAGLAGDVRESYKERKRGERKGLWASIKGWFVGGTVGIWDKLKSWLGVKSKDVAEVKEHVEEDLRSVGEINPVPAVSDAFEYSASMIQRAGDSLKDVLETKPDWKEYVKEAAGAFGVPEHMIFAIAKLESNFEPSAKNKKSGASGLGQFIPGTWDEFIEKGRKFVHTAPFIAAGPFDPKAGIFAIAWYCRNNADLLGIDLNASDAVAQIYEAHHEGPTGWKRLQAFRAGGGRFKVPWTYRNQTFDAFDVSVGGEDDCENYSLLIGRISGRVQAVADSYSGILGESEPLLT